MRRLSSRAKELVCLHAINGGLLVLILTEVFLRPQTALGHIFLSGSVVLSLLLITPRLRTIYILRRWHEPLLKIARHSKWMGIWTALWFWLYAILLLLIDRSVVWPLQVLLGGLVLSILATLVALSNAWSYQHVKWWKHINMLIWMLPALLLSYLVLAPIAVNSLEQLVICALLSLTILFGVSGVWVRQPDYFARFRLCLIGLAVCIGGLCVFLQTCTA